MRLLAPSLLLALAAALPATAQAADLVSVLGDADTVTLPGTVDLPLYSGPQGQSTPATFLTIGEHRFFVAVDPGVTGLFLSESAAGKVEAKVKSKKVNDEEFKYFEVDEAKLGDVVLSGVRFSTATDKANRNPDPRAEEIEVDVDFDGVLGLGGLTDDIAWAILPEEGVIRLAPADQGAALVSGLGGQSITTTVGPSDRIKVGKEKRWQYPMPLLGPASFAGTKVEDTAFVWSMRGNIADAAVAIPAGAPEVAKGDLHLFLVSAGPVEAAMADSWTLKTDFESSMVSYDGVKPQFHGVIGSDVLEDLSVAYDPAAQALAFKPAKKQVRKDPLPELLADAQKALDESIAKQKEAAAEAPADEAGDADKPDGDAGSWSRLAQLKAAMGDFQGAVEAREKVLAFDDETCDAHMELGNARLGANDLDGALAAYEQAGKLYHAWWDDSIPLHEKWADLDEREIALQDRAHLAALSREKYTELKAKADKKGVEPIELGLPEGVLPQPGGACMDVDAAVAGVKLAMGQLDAIPALYAARAEFDKSLPLIEGNRALAAGDTKAAAAAYRQTMRLDLDQDSPARLGLAVAQAKAGDWDLARASFELTTRGSASPDEARAFFDAWAAKDGAVKAAKAAQRASDGRPVDPVLALEWARQAAAAGDTAARDKALGRADKLIVERLAFNGDDPVYLALQAQAKLIGGDLVGARKAADRAARRQPALFLTWRVISEIEAAEGKPEAANKAMRRAIALSPASPVSALALADILNPPKKAPAPVEAPPVEEGGDEDGDEGDAPE